MFLPHFRPNASLLGIPFASSRARRRAQPRPPRGQIGQGAPRWGRHSRLPPGARPDVGARRAPRPRWPRYCFTFPGVYFSLSVKKGGGGRGDRGAAFRCRGALAVRPAGQGRVSGRPPSPAGAGPVAAPPRAALRQLPSLPPLPASLTSPPRSPSVRPSAGLSVGPGARLWGRAASSLSSRSGPSRGARPRPRPRPLQPAAAPGLALRRARGGAWQRGTPPGPPLPAAPGDARRGWGRPESGGAPRCSTCRWRGSPKDLDTAGVRTGSPES